MEQQFNNLTSAQAERLFCLLEELGEAQQAIGKILRHGYESYHPKFPETANRDNLEKEIGDIGAVLEMLVENDDLSLDKIEEYENEKAEAIKQYLHHQ